MKTIQSRSFAVLASGLALALSAAAVFAAAPPADPDPTSKANPMQDNQSATQSTTPYSSTSPSATQSSGSGMNVALQTKFDSLDINHDGYIDKQEAVADPKLSKQFTNLDANKDNKLSMTEFANAKGLALNKSEEKTLSNDKNKDR